MTTETSLLAGTASADAGAPQTPGRALRYVLITPARNEEAYLEQTIQSVIAQTHLPERWVIVSDGSTDRTDEIVGKYLDAHPWMELLRMPERKERSFGGKVHSFEAGHDQVKGIEFDVIGNLDADVTFEPDLFEFLMEKFALDTRLGVAGTRFEEGGSAYDYRYTNVEHVTGIVQMFRRECYGEIGGYVPVKGGGIDWIAVTSARMYGWKTRTFLERYYVHHRTMGTAECGVLKASFKQGRQDYYLGGHPLWQLFRAFYQATRKPYVEVGALLLAGYCWAWLTGVKRPIGRELVQFNRGEQMQRLRAKFLGRRVAQQG